MTVKTPDGTEVVVPDIWYKGKRVLRTGLAVLGSFLTAWAAFALIAPQILAELAKILPGSWIVWLTGFVATVTLVAGVITRILAIPTVNTFLTKLGLGSVPKEALEAVVYREPGQHGAEVHVVTEVKPDPKAVVVEKPVEPDGGRGNFVG
jgi:hypothetical protein